MPKKHFIVGTAGHIDHGKSTLVEALTGTDPDRLPEEKKRGMTIDLGFAHLALEDPKDAETTYHLGVIDVPGHADFVKNMVAGVGAIDLAIIIVAADDNWMPQTEEHFQILNYLGVKRGVVALTKSDLLDDPEMAIEMLREQLAGSPFADAPIVPTCALGGEGIEELHAAITDILRETPEAEDRGRPMLAVDRVFSPKGVGTVITGTLIGGSFAPGDAAKVLPAGHETTIRGIQNHLSDLDTALPGMRTALQLSDLHAGRETGKKGIGRGDVLMGGGDAIGHPHSTADVLLEKLDREVPGQPGSKTPLRHGAKVRVHHGAASHAARVFLHGGGDVALGACSLAQLRFENGVYLHAGDKIVLRDWGKQHTICGGSVLDPDAVRSGFQTPERAERLELLQSGLEDPASYLKSRLEAAHALSLEDLAIKAPFGQSQLIATLKDSGLLQEGDWVIDSDWWSKRQDTLAEAVRGFHKEEPDRPGIALGDLRAKIEPDLPDARLFEPLLDALLADGFVRAKGSLRAPEHLPELPPELVAAANTIRKALDGNPYEPPGPAEMTADNPKAEQALRFLLETGEAVQIDPKAVLGAAHLESAKQKVVNHLREHGAATAADIRQVLGTTRRVLIPLLEMMDREGLTLRNGDLRSAK